LAEDSGNERTRDNNDEVPAEDAERGTEKEVPIGVPMSQEEFRRLKEQAAEPTSGDDSACPDEDAEQDQREVEGDG
jgi:hypothetical protein